MRNRNFRIWEQIMQQRIKRILSQNERIRKGYLPRPASYFDLSEHFSTTQAATGALTLENFQQLIGSLRDEMRAGEQQSLYESLYKPEIWRAPHEWPIIGRSLWVGGGE